MASQKSEDIQISQIHIEHFMQLFDGNTVFHKYALENRIMNMVFESIKKLD